LFLSFFALIKISKNMRFVFFYLPHLTFLPLIPFHPSDFYLFLFHFRFH
jgi:hypothetical protein